MVLFLATRGETMVGRIAGIIDHHYIGFQQEQAGFSGSLNRSRTGRANLLSGYRLKANGMAK
jgi:hypothetical protein